MHQQQILRHLKKLVALQPKSQDQAAVLSVLQYVKSVLDASGCFPDTKIHDNSGFYSLTASTKGTKKPHLLLQGHVDVVPACTKTQRQLYTSGDTIAGRGVYDMLFASACYLAFFEKHAADLSGLDLGLMLTGDEEIGGFQGTEYLVEQGYTGAVCLIPDAGKSFGDLSVAAKGVYNFDLVAFGKAHHGSRPWEGDGAANKLVCLLHEFMDAFDDSDHDNSTMTVTGLNCGHATNQGPAEATAHLDIRYKDAADFERIKKVVKSLCVKYGAQTQNVMLADNLALDPKNPYIKDFIKLYEKHAGQPISLSKAHGGSDARFFASQGIPVIMLRPNGSGAHADPETISLKSLDQFYLLLEEYTLVTAKIR